MASLSTIMSLMFATASGFSILAMILVLLLRSSSLLLSITISFTLRTKDKATQSSCWSIINSRSARSFSVSAGRLILVSGRLIPFLEDNIPPRVTSTFTLPSLVISTTTTSSLPSSIMMTFPILTSPARLGYDT